jgi:hypothetical protein
VIAFRVHSSLLNVGDSIPPSTTFFDALSPEKKEVEDFLEQHRPERMLPRREAVFLFKDILEAKRWAVRTNRHIYSIELEETDLNHCGDWCWLQLIHEGLAAGSLDVEQRAKNYWTRLQATPKPVWELLARNAKVVSKVEIPLLEGLSLRAELLGLPTPGFVSQD